MILFKQRRNKYGLEGSVYSIKCLDKILKNDVFQNKYINYHINRIFIWGLVVNREIR